MSFSENLHTLRTLKGLSQKNLADIAGVSQTAVYSWEKGKMKPKIEQLQKIANALDVPITNLIDQDNLNLMNDVLDLFANSDIQDMGTIDPSTVSERFLIGNFRMLNEKGQKRATDYIEDLSKILEYQKDK